MTTAPNLYDQAAAPWPGVQLPRERFQALWARLSDTSDSPMPENAADLFLVAACLEKDAAAVAHLEALVRGVLPLLGSFRLTPDQLDTLARDTLAQLVSGEPPKLQRYSARGPLAGWVQVLMSRRVLDLQRESKAHVELEEVLLGTLTTDSAPEVELLKQRFRGSFSEAFRIAITRLQVRQRNLLRQCYLDQLSLEEMGLFYRVHRATVARWLADARAALLELTRDEVSHRLGIGRLEVDSIIRVVSSRLDLSAGIFLSSQGGAP